MSAVIKKRSVKSHGTITKEKQRFDRRPMKSLLRQTAKLARRGVQCVTLIYDPKLKCILVEGTEHVKVTAAAYGQDLFCQAIASASAPPPLPAAAPIKVSAILDGDEVDSLSLDSKRRKISDIINPRKERFVWGFNPPVWWPAGLRFCSPKERIESKPVHSSLTLSTVLKAYYRQILIIASGYYCTSRNKYRALNTASFPGTRFTTQGFVLIDVPPCVYRPWPFLSLNGRRRCASITSPGAYYNFQNNPASTELPSVSTEPPSVSTEPPSVSTETPSVSTEPPSDAIPSSFRFQIPDLVLSAKSFETLDGEEWLDGDVIDVAARLLAEDTRHRWTLYPSYVYQVADIATHPISLPPVDGRCGVIMPYNIRESHWCVAVFTPGYITVYDSKRDAGPHEDEKLKRIYDYKLAYCEAPVCVYKKVPRQPSTDGHSCGIYALSFIKWCLRRTSDKTIKAEITPTSILTRQYIKSVIYKFMME